MSGLRNLQQGIESFVSWARDSQSRIGIGLPVFDENTRGGLAKAECMMVMAASSAGKTWVALNAIANNPQVPTLFCSLEMSWRQVAARLTAITSGVPTWEMEKEIKADRMPGPLYDTVSKFPYLLCNDTSEQSIKDISASIKQGSDMIGKPIRLVVIDYLELIGGAGMLGKAEQVDKAAQKIRGLAKDHDCSVIVLHQVGKGDGSAGAEPLSLESGRYGGHAPFDAVLGLYAPRLNRNLSADDRDLIKSDVWLQLLKSRNGQPHPDGVKHTLNPMTGRITPWGVQQSLPARGFQPSFDQQSEDPYDPYERYREDSF